MRTYFVSKTHDIVLADDLCSETFEKITRRIDTYDPARAALSTWVYTVARNTLFDHYRKCQQTEELTESVSSKDNAEEIICRSESLESLARALETLARA